MSGVMALTIELPCQIVLNSGMPIKQIGMQNVRISVLVWRMGDML
jgi:hypothetical protein